MHDESGTRGGGCACDKVRFEIDGPPLLRVFCHCTICRTFNDAPFADMTLFRADAVHVHHEERIGYRAYRQPPFLLRGRCSACDGPVIERLRVPALPRAVLVSRRVLTEPDTLPAPAMHIFYDKRTADVDDTLPKHHGYLSSQLHFIAGLLKSRFANR